jgi:hypothetical protein
MRTLCEVLFMEQPTYIISDSSQHEQDHSVFDAPAWPPALIDAIRETKHCYVVAAVDDAARMNRYGLLTLAVPDAELLTRDLLKPVRFIEVLQRPCDDDTVFTLAVRRRLVDIGWYYDFNRGVLVPVQPDTAAVERDCGGDKDLFCTTILGAFHPMLQERLKPPRRERQPRPPSNAQHHSSPPFQPYSLADLQKEEIPERRWIIDGVFSEGVHVIAGPSGGGKSYWALQLCLGVAHGAQVFSKLDVEQGEALYLSLEDDKPSTKERVEWLEADGAE